MKERVGGPMGKGHTTRDLDKHVPGDVRYPDGSDAAELLRALRR